MHELILILKCLTNKRNVVPLKELMTKLMLLSQEYAIKYQKEMDVIALIRILTAFMRYETPAQISEDF